MNPRSLNRDAGVKIPLKADQPNIIVSGLCGYLPPDPSDPSAFDHGPESIIPYDPRQEDDCSEKVGQNIVYCRRH